MKDVRVSCFMVSALLALATPAAGWDRGDQVLCPAIGEYKNSMFGFAVAIPEGLRGCPNSPVDFTDHGLLIPLDGDGSRSIECYAAWNALLLQDIDAAIESDLEFLHSAEYRRTSHVVFRRRTLLGGHEAGRVAVRFQREHPTLTIVSDSTTLLWGHANNATVPDIKFKVTLTTTESMYKNDRRTLEAVLASWHLQPSEVSDGQPNHRVHPSAGASPTQQSCSGGPSAPAAGDAERSADHMVSEP